MCSQQESVKHAMVECPMFKAAAAVIQHYYGPVETGDGKSHDRIALPGARVAAATYALLSCLTKEGDAIRGCKNVRHSMWIIHSVVFDFVKRYDSMITSLRVQIGNDDVGGNGPMAGMSWQGHKLNSLQKDEFNQWWIEERGNIESRMKHIDWAFIIDVYNDIVFKFELPESTSIDIVQHLI